MRKTYSVGGQWSVIGGVAFAAGALVLAYAAALGNSEARARAEEQLRTDIDARYDSFCEQFGRSTAPGDRAGCVAALRELRSWEDDQRAFNGTYF